MSLTGDGAEMHTPTVTDLQRLRRVRIPPHALAVITPPRSPQDEAGLGRVLVTDASDESHAAPSVTKRLTED